MSHIFKYCDYKAAAAGHSRLSDDFGSRAKSHTRMKIWEARSGVSSNIYTKSDIIEHSEEYIQQAF